MIRIGWLLVILLLMSVCVGAVEQDTQAKKRVVISPDKTVEYTCRPVANKKLNQERITVQNGKSKSEVPVVMTVYDCNATSISPSGVQQDIKAHIYEIKADSASVTYSWSIAVEFNVDSVQVFNNILGRSYAVITTYSWILVEDITQPRSRDEALREVWTPSRQSALIARYLFPDRFVGRKPFSTHYAVGRNMLVRNLYADSSGNLSIDIVGTDPQEVFTFVQRNSKWEMKENK